MIPEQREALDEAIVKIRAGRMTRRTFIERVVAVGFTSAAAVSLLEACGGSTPSTGSSTASIVWQTENDTSGTYPAIVDAYNKSNKDGVHVTWHNGPSGTGDILTIYTTALRARSSSFDVMSIDVVYPAEFASNGWTVDLTNMWSASDRANYLQGPIKSCTYQGKVVAAPLRTDLGVLYYRKDIISTPPKSYEEMTSMAKSNASKAKYGYVWQGSQYEGLVCDFSEVVHGYGGDILDPSDSKKVIVNSPQSMQALTEMVSWVGTISPISVTTLTEEPCRQAFQNGDAIFMRNWPYAYSLGNDPAKSKIAGKFDIVSLPYGGSGTVGHSTTGGWNMAINAFSKNPDASWKFMQYMLGPDAQKALAIKGSFTPALSSVYNDPDVQKAQPLFTKLQPILQNTLPRPVSAVYPDLSNIIQTNVHQALTKQLSPDAALSTLQSQLQTLVSK